MERSVAIVGYGDVGRAVQRLFPDALIYDEPLGIGCRAAVNRCRFALVAVPTPALPDGACDTSIVESVVDWLEPEHVVILSTIPPGTTARLVARSGKRIVFQPTYGPGSTPDHPYHDLRAMRFVILGGAPADTGPVAVLYRTVYGPETVIQETDATTAELTKYMENAFLALKVTFCNEFYDLASVFGVDYEELRALWLLDGRIGASHTLVYPEDRGYGGKCLPKDVSALLSTAQAQGYRPSLLTAMAATNARRRGATPQAALSSGDGGSAT